MRAIIFLLGLGLTLTLMLGACGPVEHMRPDFGKLSQAFFDQQRVYPEASKEKPTGLDTEEAAIVLDQYRKNMGQKQAPREEPPQVLLLKESKEKR
jgi:hypothetical protein